MIYLYNYAGAPWKAQYWIRQTMTRMYKPTPDGYCGDEDNGQTSAWYVFSALGFYPVCPATDQYIIGTPYFKKATIQLENGKQVVINAPKSTDQNLYINYVTFNGLPYFKTWLSHTEMKKGAMIDFDMSDSPNKQRGVNVADYPYSFSKDEKR